MLRHQLSSEAAFRAATYGALVALRSRKLVTFVRAEGPTAGAGQASSAATGAAAVATGPAAAAAAAGAKAPEGGAVAGGDAAAGVAGGGGGREMGVWRATKMGKAVYDSCLPIEIGEDLYSKWVGVGRKMTRLLYPNPCKTAPSVMSAPRGALWRAARLQHCLIPSRAALL